MFSSHDTLQPEDLFLFDNSIFFTYGNGPTGRELWRLTDAGDGSPLSIQQFKEFIPGPESTAIRNLTVSGDSLFMVLDDGMNGHELWVSDGTSAGTQIVQDIAPGENDAFDPSRTPQVAAFNGGVLFGADDGAKGQELWFSDGVPGNAYMVKDIYTNPTADSLATGYAEVDGNVYFRTGRGTAQGNTLWRSDRSDSGTVPVAFFPEGIGINEDFPFTEYNGKLYFAADATEDNTLRREVWHSDGTLDGTGLLKQIGSETVAAEPMNFTVSGGLLFFNAEDGVSGRELWATDGTTAGTMLVKDIRAGSADSSPSFLTDLNGDLLFVAFTETTGNELWISDGTLAGTTLLKDINPGSANGISPIQLTVVADLLFFVANDGVNGPELWRSDGTTAGTYMVKNIRPDIPSQLPEFSGPYNLSEAGDSLYFTATDGQNGRELWKSDGTANGTKMVADIVPGAAGAFDSLDPSFPFPRATEISFAGGNVFFRADDGTYGEELWKTDGTSNGTSLVMDIRPGSFGSGPLTFVALNGRLYFTAIDSVNGRGLWESDGTPAGTKLIEPINQNTGALPIWWTLTAVENSLFFTAIDQVAGAEPWIYMADGAETPIGANVAVDPIDTTTDQVLTSLNFSSVTEPGATTVTSQQLTTVEEPPLGFKLGDPPVVFDINTSAAFDGPVDICIDYSPFAITDEASLRLYHSDDGVIWNDITTSLDTVNDVICGVTTSFSLFGAFETDPDSDGDGLGDAREERLGTDPTMVDTDGDGLLDGTEVEMADRRGCPSPILADSDADGLIDGYEVLISTNPCNQDTDGDGVLDTVDAAPLDPNDGGFISDVEQATRNVADWISQLHADVFDAPNTNSKEGRQNSLASRVRNAANAIADGDYASAYTLLNKVLERVDGRPKPDDWMLSSETQETTAGYLESLIEGVSY